MIIYLDFDGTVVEHAYPKIGREVPHAIRVIKRLQDAGHEIILNTYRVEMDEKEHQKALNYLNKHYRIELEPITSTDEKFSPNWDPGNTEVIYIDDMAPNSPKIPAVYDGEWMVDWLAVEKALEENNVLPKGDESLIDFKTKLRD